MQAVSEELLASPLLEQESDDGLRKTQGDDDSGDTGSEGEIAAQIVDVTLGSISDEAKASIQVEEPRDLFAGSDLKRVVRGSQHNRLSEILSDAEKALRNVFGMHLIRLDHTQSGLQVASTSWATKVAKEEVKKVPEPVSKLNARSITKYMLLSAFPSNVARSALQPDAKKDAQDSTIFLVLSAIFNTGNPISKDPQCKSIMIGDSVKEKDEPMKLIIAQGRNDLENQVDVNLLNDAQSISSRSDSFDLPDNDDTLTDESDFSNEDASDTGTHFSNTDVCDSDVGAADSDTGNASTTGIAANLPTATADSYL
ncbi:unnamed protein product [Orchesella dallaii]|uniref:MAGE domain-containing protein n=1 Tax=Orchesella dallaii TaxID=48710 RepID=A0ABP1PTU5_9HEXA